MEGKQPNVVALLIMRWTEPQLRRTQRLLEQANTQLDKALKENKQLINTKELMARKVEGLERDNQALHRDLKGIREEKDREISKLRDANKLQSEMMDRMERQQKDLMDRVERLTARVMQLEVERGNTPTLPIE